MNDPKPQDNPAQSQRFMELALELGIDADASALDNVLAKVIALPSKADIPPSDPVG